jgi:hypothetical protein
MGETHFFVDKTVKHEILYILKKKHPLAKISSMWEGLMPIEFINVRRANISGDDITSQYYVAG